MCGRQQQYRGKPDPGMGFLRNLEFPGTGGYADGGDEMVIDSVTMDRIGVPLLTIDARDGSVVQRVQSGPSTTFPGGIGECE